MCVHPISLGGEGNALYPVLSSFIFVHIQCMFLYSILYRCLLGLQYFDAVARVTAKEKHFKFITDIIGC